MGSTIVILAQVMAPQSSDATILKLLGPIPWFAWIAIVAILGSTAREVLAQLHRHQERMAMIQNGLHPDAEASFSPPVAKPGRQAMQEL